MITIMEGKTPVIPLVESALGIEGTNNIAKVLGVFRPAFGSGDLCRGKGMPNTQEPMTNPRTKLPATP